MKVISRVPKVLKEQKTNKTQLAKDMKVDRSSITRLANIKNYTPTLETALLLAKILNCKVEDLFKLK